MDPLPDIGLDPLKHRDQVKIGVEGARERLTKALCIQQPEVPDQTALVWRIDIDRVLMELTLMTSRWENREAVQAALEKCFLHLGNEIERKTLNDSAADGTQALSAEVARVLDAVHAKKPAA